MLRDPVNDLFRIVVEIRVGQCSELNVQDI